MTITLTWPEIASLVFAVVIVIWLASISRTTWKLDQFVKGLVAHAKAAQIPPDPNLIKQWIKQYESPETSGPKRNAYKNRLIEVGVLDADGKKIKVQAE